MSAVAGTDQPRLAVVMPVYKHSVLVAEAITSVLDQDMEVPYLVVLVNDGCPFPETHTLCLEFARAYPERIRYIRRRNGKLSCARNTGVRHVLERYPSVESFYFLDADNRLCPPSLGKAFACLAAHPDADWVYPDIGMFGMSLCCKYPGIYSLLLHSFMNLSEAGSMVRRRVFEHGVFYDESMQLGYEDWDFWLQAARCGFRGTHLPDFGFLYRKRPESMLADSYRDEEEILAYIRRKHKWLYNPRSIIALEHSEAPRYAVFLADKGIFRMVTDPTRDGFECDIATFDELCWRAHYCASDIRLPAFLVVTTSDTMQLLAAKKLIHFAFWQLEFDFENEATRYSALSHLPAGEEQSVELRRGMASVSNISDFAAIMLRMDTFIDIIARKTIGAKGKLDFESVYQNVWCNTLVMDAPTEELPHQRGLFDLMTLVGNLHRSRWRDGALQKKKIWYNCCMPSGTTLYALARQSTGLNKPLYPRIPDGRRHIGYLLPVASFGGVEKVAYSVARELKKHGYVPHLFVLGAERIKLPEWAAAVFESVNLFPFGETQKGWDGDGYRYFGSAFPKWQGQGDHRMAVGQLAWLDGVINGHCAPAHAIMGALRRLGLCTINHIHVLDYSVVQREMGHPILGLAYENAYDMVLTVSGQMRDWCHGMGIPSAKLLHVPNGPGYPMTPREIAAALQSRTPPEGRKLRVLYLGRLDAQKGLTDLAEFGRLAREPGSHVEFRVVGDAIMSTEFSASSVLEPFMEPAAWDAAELTALYAWADVLVMFSKWEGLPLTILEAMRLGVVVLSPNVGATAEAVEHEVTGFLLGENPARQAMEIIQWLLQNPRQLAAMSHEAAKRIGEAPWENACGELVARLEQAWATRKPGQGTTAPAS